MKAEDSAVDAERDHQVFLYILAARGFADAATAAYDFRYRVGTPWPAIVVNLSFAIELSLKAYIYSKTGNADQLRNISHDLAEAFSVASNLGFVPVEGLKASLEGLQQQHRDLSVRYLSTSWFIGGDLETHLDMVHRLVASASVQAGVGVQGRWSRNAWRRPSLLPDTSQR